MIRRNRAQSSSLFLMELILAILFFSITSAVCVQFFVKSHLLSRESKTLSQAVSECSGIAEITSVSDSADAAAALLRDRYPDIDAGQTAGSPAVIYYDDSFSPCGERDAVYTLETVLAEDDGMLSAGMKVTGPDESLIYELSTSHHIPRRTDYEKR